MATAVYNREEIELLDGTTLTLKAMSIKSRRDFMKRFNELAESEKPEDYDFTDSENDLIKLIPYCVAGQRPEWENVWSNDEKEQEEALDALLGALDPETTYYIIKQVVGLDLKAQDEQIRQLMLNAEQPGTI